MNIRRLVWIVCVFALFFIQASPSLAVRPDEVLGDPALEQRARDISAGLRCLVCQNQSIDDSDAQLARDLRVLVRERLSEGDSDEDVIAFVVSRYGEFVLLKPRLSPKTILLWGAPLLVLFLGLALVIASSRKRRQVAPSPLSREDDERIKKILGERDDRLT